MSRFEDPIVEEVRRVREQNAAKFDFDIKAIIADARKRQAESNCKVVSFAPPQPQEPTRKRTG